LAYYLGALHAYHTQHIRNILYAVWGQIDRTERELEATNPDPANAENLRLRLLLMEQYHQRRQTEEALIRAEQEYEAAVAQAEVNSKSIGSNNKLLELTKVNRYGNYPRRVAQKGKDSLINRLIFFLLNWGKEVKRCYLTKF
jgi:hypothetical protein